jgi:toxin ParE1/3/4
MAEIAWTEPALAELDATADYLAFDNPLAARRLVQRMVARVGQLASFPQSGSRVPEMPGTVYRQLVLRPCRIFYRRQSEKVFIVFIMRGERLFRKEFLGK